MSISSYTAAVTPEVPLVTPSVDEDSGCDPIVLRFAPLIQFNKEQYFEFVMQNSDLRLERALTGEVVVMSPTGGEGSVINSKINLRLGNWAEAHGGYVLESSCEFELPNGAARCPDASWVSAPKWEALTPAQRKKFPPICPEFIIELRSETDRLKTLQAKMLEYMESGAKLAWLIDPLKKTVHIYRPGQAPEILENPASVSGESVLPGFELNVQELFALNQ